MADTRKLGTLAEEFERNPASSLEGVMRVIAQNAFYSGAAIALIKTLQGDTGAAANEVTAMLKEAREYDSAAALDRAMQDEASLDEAMQAELKSIN